MTTLTRSLLLALCASIALLALSTPGFAQTAEATVAMVLAGAQGNCANITPPSCATPDLKISGDLYTPYYALLCVMNADPDKGIGGVSLGVDYDNRSGSGVDVVQWTLCSDGLEFPSSDRWPEAGTGTRITWSTCQLGMPDGVEGRVTAVAGYFYVSAYSNDTFAIVKNPVQSGAELKVAECDPQPASFDVKPEHAGILGFSDDGSEKGRLECAKIQTVNTTWGRVKEMYGNR